MSWNWPKDAEARRQRYREWREAARRREAAWLERCRAEGEEREARNRIWREAIADLRRRLER